MSTETIIALITAGGSLLGTFSGIIVSSKLTAYRIEQLEKKVDKHNGVIDRTYALEKRSEVFEEKLKVVNHRVDDLEAESR